MQSYSFELRSNVVNLLRLARPVHWVKNGFVLAPALFTLDTQGSSSIVSALLAFAGFCLAASFVYVVNDLKDVEYDRLQPAKRDRPLASGSVSLRSAIVLAGICGAGSVSICLFLTWRVGLVLGAYVLLNFLYTFKLKDVVLLDVMTIAAGFMLRVAAGAAAIGVAVSPWMIHTTFFLSLFLGFSKRRNELVSVASRHRRRVLREYSESFLNLMLAISLSLTIVTYSLYVIQPVVVAHTRGDGLLYTVPVVVYGLLRFLYLVVKRKQGGDVAEVVVEDPWLIASILIWAVAVVFLMVIHP